MAEINSKLATQAESLNGQRPDSVEAEGRARFLNDTVIFDGAVTAGDYVALLSPLPKGALVDPSRSTVVATAALSGVTVDVGIEGVDDNVVAGASVATTGIKDGVAGNLIKVVAGVPKLKINAGTPALDSEVRVSLCYYVR